MQSPTPDIILSYANNGTHDIEAPLIHLEADRNIGFVNIQDGDEFVGTNSMTLLGISNEGSAGILRPGEIGTIRLRGQAGGGGRINISASQVEDDGTPLDYEQFINYLGGDIADPAWSNAANALEEQFGTSWSSFASGLAALATERSTLEVYSHSVNELWADVALDAWSDRSIDRSGSQLESSSNIASANLVQENTENFNINSSTIPEPELLEDTQNPLSLQSVLQSAEQIILDGASVIRNEYGAVNAAFALEKFVNQLGLETPPSGSDLGTPGYSYEIIEKYADETINESYSKYIRKDLNGWKNNSAYVNYFPGGPSNQDNVSIEKTGSSSYKHDVPYETTFHANYSAISDAIRNSSSYQSKVKNNQTIKEYIEEYIDDKKYQGSNDLSNDPIYINNDEINGVFGDSNDFNYFDQNKLAKATINVIGNLLQISSLAGTDFGTEVARQYRDNLDASVQDLQNLHNQYFGTAESAELALLMGRTAPETRWARIDSINIEEADCQSPEVSYEAHVDFFLLDGTTFNADDSYKDEFFQILSYFEPGLGLLNFMANPFGGEDYFNRDNINNLLKVVPALGLGWDVQQFGYGKPHFNLVKIEDTITGTIPNPNHEPNCQGPPHNPPTSPVRRRNTTTDVFVSYDPNDILGPEGYGEEKWIDAEDPLEYTIRFENDPELASAPAQVVKITQQLDEDLDFRTFRLGDFGFGDTFIDVPENRAFYQTRLDLVEEKGIYVDVFAGIDIATGEAFWELRSIDPETGEQPNDPLLGFLPPNITKPEGDGFVDYSIRTDRDIETGAVIDAEATIIFDINEPIDTPPIFNTIDAGKPTSTVNALPDLSDSEEFTVSWFGSDDDNGSAIADYTIYVAEDGGEFTPWLENTTLTEAVFTGTPGSSYEFYAVARDNAGNVQDIPTTAQASTAIAGGNNPPVLVNPIGTQVVAEDSNFSLTISEEIFADSDAGDVLTYSATLSDGSELPNWLTFDAETKTFGGIPTNEDLGNLSILVTVSDIEGETASDSFDLIVENVNDTPILNNAIALSTATEGKVFSFTFAEDTFSDVDAGDSLTYSATLSNGSGIPAWLAFNAETRTFSGTPANENVGNLNIQITATDNDGESISTTFELEVVNVNDTPVLKRVIANQTAIEDEAFGFTFSVDTFDDVDTGDSLTYTATLANGGELPNWITFDAETRTFSGIPVNQDVGNQSIKVTATDNDGESVSSTFDLEVVNVNDAPTLLTAIVDQIATEDEKFNFTFTEDTFDDVDAGDSLTYTVTLSDGSELPSWLTFDAETRTFSGTPVNEDVGTLSIQVTATDNNGEVAIDTFDLEVINVNDIPSDIELSNIVIDENSSNGTVVGNLSTVDPDLGDTFSHTLLNDADGRFILDGNELQVASGSSLDFEVNSSHEIEIQTTDAEGLSIAKNFTLYLNNINEAPVIVDDSVTANSSSSKVIPISYLLENDSDPEGDSLTLTAVGNTIRGTVSIDGDNVIFTNDGSSSSGSFEYTVSDGKFSNTATVTIDIGVTENGSNSSDTIVGTSGDDSYRGRNGNDSISGFAGDDSIKGENGNDTLDGGIGNDTLDGGNNDDYLFGGLGVDYLIGGQGFDTLDGGEDGDFYLARHNNIDVYSDSGTEGIDVILAEGQNNFNLELGLIFNSDSGIEQIDGTSVSNKFEIRANGSNQDNIWDFSELNLLGVDVINGRKGNDSILGSAGDDSIKGEDGHDTLNGGLGSDTLDGGKHNDTLSGDAGVDYLIGGEGIDRLDGGEDGDFYLARHNNIDVYSDTGTDGMDVILAEGQNNFNLELGLTFNADSGIEVIDGTAITNKFEIRANGSNEGNTWDFSELDLLGVDVINGRKGNDSIIGSMGDDSIKGEDGNDTLNGGIGSDSLDGGKNDDYLLGGLGVDYLIGGEGLDTLDGGEDGDFYLARHNNIDVYSDSGSDGVDVILAEGHSNFNLELGLAFNSDSGIEQIDGSGINDKFEIRANGSNQDNIWDFSDLDLLGVDVINGRKGNDSIIGSTGDDSIKGEDGNDTLNGGIGSDTLDGGKHDDYLLGGAGIDYLIGGEGSDTLNGGDGGDFYLARHNNIDVYSDSGTDGVDVILAEDQNNFNLELGLTFNSDSGIEQIDGTAIANKFEIRASGSNQNNIWDFSDLDLLDVDVINGRKGNDSIIGSMGDDSIKGEDGNDTLNGGIGSDSLDGGKNDDYLLGGLGVDYLIGGEGLDTLDGGEDGDFYLARHNNVDAYLDSGSDGVDVILAEGQNNFNLELGLTFNADSGIEAIDGSGIGNKFEIRANGSNQSNVWDFSDLNLLSVDVINGRKGNDSIIGSMGDDSIKGEDGQDTLNGGQGTDTLDGGNNDDYLFGGLGNDTLIGGKGKDSFVFNNPNEGVDTITDFSVKDDTLIFSAAGFSGDLIAGEVESQMFTIDTVATSAEHRFIYDAGSGDLFYDSDGIGDDEQIKLVRLDSGLNLGSDDLFINS